MARPRLGEGESKRLQMFITEDELSAIEDWQFANRISSKSEAIRRLCQLGLLFEKRLPNLIEQTVELAGDMQSDELPAMSSHGEADVDAVFKSLDALTAKNLDFRAKVLGEVISILAEAQILHQSNVDDITSVAEQLRKKIEGLGVGSEESTEYVLGVLREMLKDHHEIDQAAGGGAQ